MTDPLNHHYIPRFLQKRWADKPDHPNGRVFRYTFPYDKLVKKHVSTRASGSEVELYSRRTVDDPKERQAVEVDFMSKLDNDAAFALKAIEVRPRRSPFLIIPQRPLPLFHRTAWARFLMSMMLRSPYRVRWFVDELHARWSEDKIEAKYERIRSPDDPAKLAEWVNSYGSDIPIDASAIGIIQMLIDSSLIIPHLIGMRWKTAAISESDPLEYLFSDDAVTTSNGINKPDSFIMMPTGPKTIFIAANRDETIGAFLSQGPQVLAHAVNDSVVKQARSTVISRSDNLDQFISERFDPQSEQARSERLTWQAPIVYTNLLFPPP